MTSINLTSPVGRAPAALACVWLTIDDRAHPLVSKWIEKDEPIDSRACSVAGQQFSGGDAPGMNAAIRAILRTGTMVH